MINLKCAGCGKSNQEVRVLVALTDKLYVCNECVETCAELCSDINFGGAGFVKVATQELEALRRQVHQATLANIWMDGIRQSVAQLNTALEKYHKEKNNGI